jgi:uncharacterized protein (DUF1697 family)
MALVVFLRGVHVGGRKSFSPKALAEELAEFGAVNIGAAGTFVVRKAIAPPALRAEILRRLPVRAEFMVCRSREVLDLAAREPFGEDGPEKDQTRYASVLANRPRTLPALPIGQPPGDDWQVKVIGVTGRFALSLHRRTGRALVYPNEVVEKKLGVVATTRNWSTIGAVCQVLRDGGRPGRGR